MKIHKVRLLDVLGKEVAEFGFYEDYEDAERRRAEVASMIHSPGTLEVRSISVVPSVRNKAVEAGLDYYVLKGE